MDLKTASRMAEQIAHQVATSGIPGTLRCASQISNVYEHLCSRPGEAPGDTRVFDAQLEPLYGAWWVPERNLVAHRGNEAWSFWSFTMLPFYAEKTAYREDLGGIVVRPRWRLASDRFVSEMTPELAKAAVEKMQGWPTLQETGHRELAWIESTFGMKVPDRVATPLLWALDKQAHVRWPLNRLALKDRLIPLDGGPARDLGDWE